MQNHVRHSAPWICATLLSACLAGCGQEIAAFEESSSSLTTNQSVRLLYDWSFGTQARGFFKSGKNLAYTAHPSSGSATATRPDHRVLVAGTLLQPGDLYCPLVTQFTANGVLDTTFGTGGSTTVSLCSVYTQINAAVLQPDGKTVVGGRYGNGFLLLRLLADGTLDTGFGFFGAVATTFSGSDWINTLALQPDGRIVAGGIANHLVRYNANGTLDASFGSAGVAFSPSGIAAIALQSDGKIVAISTPDNLTVARFTASGALDPTFAHGGLSTLPVGGGGASVVIRPDGKIVAGGFHDSVIDGAPYETGLVARLLPTGALDTTFNGTGLVDLNSVGHNHRRVVAVQSLPDGSVVTAGWDNSWNGDAVELVMAHVFDDGTLDPNFGTTQAFFQSDFSPLGSVVNPHAIVLDSLPQTRVVLVADIGGSDMVQQMGVARLMFATP